MSATIAPTQPAPIAAIKPFTAPSTSSSRPQAISKDQEQQFILYGTTAQRLLSNMYTIRPALANIDRAYMREMDFTKEQNRARWANRAGDATKFQNITVPIVMPQVRAALGYMANVFLTGYPMFGVASDPTNIDAAKQMETIIAENSVTAQWARQLLMFFNDGLKYNWHALEVVWEQKNAATIVTNPADPSGSSVKQALWNGNVIRRCDPYNSFFDPRCHPADLASTGEFAGYNEILSRTQLKQYLNDVTTTVASITLERALQSTYAMGAAANGAAPFSYYQPLLNPEPLMNQSMLQGFDWMSWFNGMKRTDANINYGNCYIKTTMYCRIIPNDFNLTVPGRNTPQIWKVVYINGQVVVQCERVNYAHNYLPIIAGQPLEDGLRFQTKSFAQNVIPMQEVASAMMNGLVASKRRLIGDRMIYDPLRIREADINSDSPTAKIPVRPAAYGKNLAEAVFPIPYRDENTASFAQVAKIINDYANMINQQNPAQQGQFVKGNKTLHEYEDTMGHGNAGNQMMAITTESQVFVIVKEILKLNILQFQQPAVYYNQATRESVQINPVQLRNAAVQFKISDGLIPKDKEMGTDEWTTAIQGISSSDRIGAAYNVGPMFSYLMKLRGADLTPFEKSPEQQQYEQQMGAWQQAAQYAADKGTEFSTPMPQAPPPQQPQTPASSVALAATQGPQ